MQIKYEDLEKTTGCKIKHEYELYLEKKEIEELDSIIWDFIHSHDYEKEDN